jgi:sec-independent protein translocase protein TatB
MFNIGGGELIVILLIALIVLGPQRLPDAARQIGKTMGELRRLSSGFQNEMKQALETADDPTRVAARRNVLARDTPTDPTADGTQGAEPDAAAPEPAPVEVVEPAEPPAVTEAAAESIAAVSGQPSAPPKLTPPAAEARAAARKDEPADVPEPPSPRTPS